MDGDPDATATEDLIRATMEAERAWEDASLAGEWQTTLDDMVVKPSIQSSVVQKSYHSSRRKESAA